MEGFEYKVSVIVPVYNAEEYLRDCLDSLLMQTIDQKEMEVLLINDGSTDGSLEICREYEEIYDNFKVFSKENEGLPVTRNFGIKKAKGKYIIYLDSDDKFTPPTLKNVCNFFDEHYEEIDEVTFPIIRYKNGSTLSMHYRYKYLTKTGIYDLNKYPFITQANINICVKNMKDKNIFFNTTPEFRHEDLAYNNEILSNKMKIGFVKEAEYQYNRDNESSIIANYMYAYYIFETTTKYYEDVFANYDHVPQYFQAHFFNDLVWKFAESRLWPYHYESDKLSIAKTRIYRLLDKVDVNTIMAYPSADNYQKIYWLRQKENITLLPLFCKNYMSILVNGKDIYSRKDVEIILKRIVVTENRIKIVGFYKSPLFSMIEKPYFYVLENNKPIELEVTLASSSYHKGKDKTDTFWGFEYTVDLNSVKEKNNCFKLKIDNIIFNTVFYNTITVPFYKARLRSYAVKNFIISQNNDELIFKKTSINKANELRWNIHKKYLSNTNIYKVRIGSEKYVDKKIWLYYDNYTVTYDNGYLQFLHDIKKDDGVDRYYILDGDQKKAEQLFGREYINHIIPYGSFKHKVLYLCADKILTSFIENFSLSPFEQEEESFYRDLIHAERIYLQHGVLHAHLPWFYTPIGVEVDKVVVSSYFEIKNFQKNYSFHKENILPFGMPRYSIIDKEKRPKNKIVFAPSWRSYLIGEPGNGGKREGNAEKLIKSNYYTNIMKFLNNNKLIKYLDKKDLFIELKLHPNFFDMYKGTINFDSDRISLSENKIDLTEYKIFITDFSSFVFDYAYLNRPILYFVPDYLEFKSGMNRYRELDLPFEEAFGPLTVESEQAVDELIKICERNFIPEPIYRKRMQEFYLPVKDPCGQLYEYLRKESVNI